MSKKLWYVKVNPCIAYIRAATPEEARSKLGAALAALDSEEMRLSARIEFAKEITITYTSKEDKE